MADGDEIRPGTHQPLAAGDQESALYEKFDSYPWANDREFMFGATAMRTKKDGEDESSQGSVDLMRHSRMWWFLRKYNVTIDLAAYKKWLEAHPDHQPPDAAVLLKLEKILAKMRQPAEPASPASLMEENTSPASIPSWQAAAPKADLRVKHDTSAKREGSNSADAPYPDRFAVIVEAIAAGKPVPGIRDIPNKVVRKPGIAPFGSRQTPRKPWEKESASHRDVASGLPDLVVDQQFPDVDAPRPRSDDDLVEEDSRMREG